MTKESDLLVAALERLDCAPCHLCRAGCGV